MLIKELWRKCKQEYTIIKENDNSKLKIEAINKNSNNYKKHKNKLVNAMIFNLIITVICSTVMYYIVDHMHELQDDFIAEQNSMNSTYILYVKNIIDARSSSKLKDISHNIVDAIQNEMDKEELQKQLNSGTVSKELDSLFRNQIMNVCTVDGLDAQTNNIFICNSDGILADYSEVYAAPKNTKRTWDYELKSQQNKGMYKHTIELLLTQDSTDFLVEEKVSNIKGHELITTMDQDKLFEIFTNEGLDGIKDYTFLVPVYIMKNNDVFGVADIIDGQRIDNNKFVIVQRYSLYDYIKTFHLDSQVNIGIHFKFEHMFFMFYLFIILYVSLSILTIVYFISIFNRSVEDAYNSSNNDSSNFLDRRSPGRRSTDKYAAQILELVEQERQRKAKENITIDEDSKNDG